MHHTAVPNGTEFSDYRDAIHEIFLYHALPAPTGQGWGDVGYYLVIDPDGVIYAGRSTGRADKSADGSPIFRPGTTLARGAEVVTAGHVYRANTGNIGVSSASSLRSMVPQTIL